MWFGRRESPLPPAAFSAELRGGAANVSMNLVVAEEASENPPPVYSVYIGTYICSVYCIEGRDIQGLCFEVQCHPPLQRCGVVGGGIRGLALLTITVDRKQESDS